MAEARESAALKTYNQDAARLKSGTISAVELQTSQLALKKAQFSRLQAQDNVLEALAALSVASGQNLTGYRGGDMTTTLTPARSSVARPRRWPLLVLGALLIGTVGGGMYLARTQAETAVAVPTVNTQTVQHGVVRVSVSGPGTLEAAATRTMGADQAGTVGTVPPVGERVNKGQLLTRLSSDAVEQGVQTAQLNLDRARASLDAHARVRLEARRSGPAG